MDIVISNIIIFREPLTNYYNDEAGYQQKRCHFSLEIIKHGTDRVAEENAQRDAAEDETHDFRSFVFFGVLRCDQRHARDCYTCRGNTLNASGQKQHLVRLSKSEHCDNNEKLNLQKHCLLI